ncbi:MAG TPA: DUF47 family protein [Spirochaetota bacterium]|nr:DUF47 family protein [Spirochaetota bacterium]
MFKSFKRNRRLVQEINRYLGIMDRSFQVFNNAVTYWLHNGPDNTFQQKMEKVTGFEHEADDLVHNIEKALYKKSLLPEVREDIMLMLESMDDVIDQSHSLLQDIYSQQIAFAPSCREDMLKLLQITLETQGYIAPAVNKLFERKQDISEDLVKINEYEAQCDVYQIKIISTIFSSGEEGSRKILQRDIVKELGHITDFCENTADVISIINVKKVY